MAYINNLGQVRIGVRGWVAAQSGASVTDSDATAFVTAAGITDSTQISALNTLVTDLKTYGLWTKMKAIYPFVGGSAASHKFNLKDPRDLDAAYRLVFNGGWVHSSNGVKPNGTTGYAETKLIPNNTLTTRNTHISVYSRENTIAENYRLDMGSCNLVTAVPIMSLSPKYDSSSRALSDSYSLNTNRILVSNSDSRGFYLSTRTSINSHKLYQNTSVLATDTVNDGTNSTPQFQITIGSFNFGGSIVQYSNRELAFSSIGDGLTDTEAANFYISVQKFQTTLGRHVGTPYVSDPDAIAFLMAAGITDGTQAAAINTLVIRMKADGVWTKMKAIYPFVGGSAFSHKFNLKDPRDLDAAFRLVFNGGWAHSSTGAKPNGTTGYANTFLNESIVLLNNNSHVSVYSRTDLDSTSCDIGVTIGAVESNIYSKIGSIFYPRIQANNGGVNVGIVSSQAFYLSNRVNETQVFGYRNSTKYIVSSNSLGRINNVFYLAANHRDGTPQHLSSREQAFASIGDGLTDTEATAFYTAVQAYQTTLGRQVNIPVVSDTDAQAFLNAANITSFQQASAVNKLVVDLKAAGVWTKMKAIYPFVGGSAASHKWNLKDPRDLDVAYRLVFNGGWTHTSTGAQPNGTTGYADTKLIPSSNLNLNSVHLSTYLRTNTTGNYADMGAISSIGSVYLQLLSKWSDNKFYAQMNDADFNDNTVADSLGLFIGNRSSSTSVKSFKNTTTITSKTTSSVSLPNNYIFLGGRTSTIGQLQSPSNREQAFASIGDGLTDTEATALYTAIQTYQTSLGRAVNTPIYNDGLVLNLDAGNANSYPGTGTTWFDLEAGNNGTLTNGPTYDTANGGSIVFDGYNDFVIINSILDLQGNKPFTVVGWFKKNSDWSNGATWGIGGGGNTRVGINSWNYNNTNEISIDLWGTSTYTTNQTYSSTEWKHIAWVYNGTTFTTSNIIIYINSVPYTGNNLSILRGGGGIPSVTSGVVLGRAGVNDSGYGSKPKISKFSIYNRVLTQSEILENFNSSRGRFGL